MQWMIGKFAWFFFKTMNVSGAEAIVAASSPWVGQGESACLVKPYVDIMTDSELHLVMTSGFSTIAGSVFGAYVALGVDPKSVLFICYVHHCLTVDFVGHLLQPLSCLFQRRLPSPNFATQRLMNPSLEVMSSSIVARRTSTVDQPTFCMHSRAAHFSD